MSERKDDAPGLNPRPEFQQIEQILTALVPRESHVNRDRLMFLAGEASAVAAQRRPSLRINRWIWPATAIVSACAGLWLGVFVSAHPGVNERPIERETAERSPAIRTIPKPVVATRGSQETVVEMTRDSAADELGEIDWGEGVWQSARRDLLRQLRRSRWDDEWLSQLDAQSPAGTAAWDFEQPTSYRDLLKSWNENGGRNPF
jgi:hypothetical protein